MQAETERCGLEFVAEVFADRAYLEDGSLVPRGREDALIEDPVLAVRQALEMVRESRVITVSGRVIQVVADSICIHGDGRQAFKFAHAIHEALVDQGILIRSPGQAGVF
jgi:UPF0271 protein